MKILFLAAISLALSALGSFGAVLTQTFEAGEDTSNWGADWVNLNTNLSGFLSEDFGGLVAGGGDSINAQQFSRSFKDNTIGLDETTANYVISMYLTVGAFDDPASGEFQILNGNVGASAGGFRLKKTGVPNVPNWSALDGSSWVDFATMDFVVGDFYQLVLAINPTGLTYTATVNKVDGDGNILATDSLSSLSIDSSTISNGESGQLLFYALGASGDVGFKVDNINIAAVPEPATAGLIVLGVVVLIFLKRRQIDDLAPARVTAPPAVFSPAAGRD